MHSKVCRHLFTAILALGGAASIVSVAAANPAPTTGPAAPVEGWKASADPVDLKGKPRGDLRMTVPIKHGASAARSTPGSPFVAISDNFDRGQAWFISDLRVGTFRQAFVASPSIERAVISFDGDYLAGVNNVFAKPSHGVQLWSLKSGKLVQQLTPPHNADIWLIGFGAVDRLVGFQNDNFEPTLPVWDAKTGAVLFTIAPGKEAGIDAYQCSVSPGGRFVAMVQKTQLRLFSTADGSKVVDMPLPPVQGNANAHVDQRAKGIAFSFDGGELAVICEAGWDQDRILAWDMSTGKLTADCQFARPRDSFKDTDVRFEVLPERMGWRFGRSILDRGTGQQIYLVPPPRENQEGLVVKALDADHVIVAGEPEFGGHSVPLATVTLPRAEMAKSSAALQAGGKAIDAKLPPLTRAQWPATQPARAAGPTGWMLKPDLATAPALSSAPIPLRSAAPAAREDVKPTSIVFSGVPANSAAISFSHGADNQVWSTSIDRIPLAGGTPATLDVPAASDVLDLSADGSRVVLRTEDDRLDVFALGAGAPGKHVIGFRPYDRAPAAPNPSPFNIHKVVLASLIDNDHLLTDSESGLLTLWSLSKCQAIWWAQVDRAMPCLSPNRRIVVASLNEWSLFLDTSTGATLGGLQALDSGDVDVSISPDGARFARFNHQYGSLTVVDLASGQATSECTVKAPGHASIHWCGRSHMLLNDSSLVDLELRQVIWSFFPSERAAVRQPDLRFWCAARDQSKNRLMLTPFVLPHDEAVKLVAGLNKDDMIVVKPGVKVTLDVNIAGGEARNQKVTEQLTQKLTQLGMQAAPDQPLHLQATLTQTGSIEEKYSGGHQETVNIPLFEWKIAFQKDGASVWENSGKFRGSGAGMFVQVKQGHTIQEMIDQYNADAGGFIFTNCRLPKYASKPIEPLNQSMFTATGLREVKPRSQ